MQWQCETKDTLYTEMCSCEENQAHIAVAIVSSCEVKLTTVRFGNIRHMCCTEDIISNQFRRLSNINK